MCYFTDTRKIQHSVQLRDKFPIHIVDKIPFQQQNLQHLCGFMSASRKSLIFFVGVIGFHGILSSGMTLFVRRNFPLQMAHLLFLLFIVCSSGESSSSLSRRSIDVVDLKLKCGIISRLRKLGRGLSQKFFNLFVVMMEPSLWSKRMLSLFTFS